jgi:integrase
MTDAAVLTPQAAAFERIKAIVLDSLPSLQSKRAYGHALDSFLSWSQREAADQPFTKALANTYRSALEARGLAASTVNVHMAAVRKLAWEAADNGMMPRDVAAAIARVKGVGHSDVRTGTWPTLQLAEALLEAPNAVTLKGKRDRALLAVLVGCGLRREEAARLALEHIQQRESRWVIVDMPGKGGRIRTVPMPSWTKAAIGVWTTAAAITSGRVFRSLNKGGKITGASMTAQAIFEAVKLYGAMIGVPELAPHDLRRTFARLAHKGRAALEQIQLSLGHASVTTTERYLGTRQDLTDAPCDRLGLKVEGPATFQEPRSGDSQPEGSP